MSYLSIEIDKTCVRSTDDEIYLSLKQLTCKKMSHFVIIKCALRRVYFLAVVFAATIVTFELQDISCF